MIRTSRLIDAVNSVSEILTCLVSRRSLSGGAYSYIQWERKLTLSNGVMRRRQVMSIFKIKIRIVFNLFLDTLSERNVAVCRRLETFYARF